jgi:hypothetical protein
MYSFVSQVFMDQQITAVIVNRKEHKLVVRYFIIRSFYLTPLSILGNGTEEEQSNKL